MKQSYKYRYSPPQYSRGVVEKKIGNLNARIILCPECKKEFTHLDTGTCLASIRRLKSSGEACPVVRCPICGQNVVLLPHLREGASLNDEIFAP